MSSHTIEDLTSCILDFQANIIRVTYRKKTTLVEADHVVAHHNALKQIWAASKLEELDDGDGGVYKWRQIGFESEDLSLEFGDSGVLGLDCLVRFFFARRKRLPDIDLYVSQKNFALSDPDMFAQVRYGRKLFHRFKIDHLDF